MIRNVLVQRASAIYALMSDKGNLLSKEQIENLTSDYRDCRLAMQAIPVAPDGHASLWDMHCEDSRLARNHDIRDVISS
jgi:hypothetical protein